MTIYILGALTILALLVVLAALKPEWFNKVVAAIGVVAAAALALWDRVF